MRCYAVDGLLIDTGLYAKRRAILDFAATHRVRRCLITHHHEDHSNNAIPLQSAGIPVHAAAPTGALVRRGFGTHPYQWLVWGRARPTELAPLPEEIETEAVRRMPVRSNFSCVSSSRSQITEGPNSTGNPSTRL